MPVNVEKIRLRLEEFDRKQKEWELAHPEEAKKLREERKAEAEDEARRERAFVEGERIAEEEEQKMIDRGRLSDRPFTSKNNLQFTVNPEKNKWRKR